MMGFDDVVPQDLGQLLNPQATVPQMNPLGGMMQALQAPPQPQVPQEVQQPQGEPGSSTGLLAGAQGWLAQNPKMAQMLMTTFASLAGNGDIGKAVQHGALAGFSYDNEQYQRNSADQKRKDDLEHRQSGRALDEKRLGIDEERLGIAKEDAIGNREYRAAQTEATRTTTAESRRMTDPKIKLLEKQIETADDKIANSKNDRERQVLQMKRDKLALSLEEKYGEAERKGKLGLQTAQTASVVSGAAENMAQTRSTNAKADQDEIVNGYLKSLPPQDAVAFLTGGKKNGKAPNERFQEYVVKARVANPEADMNTLWSEFQQIETMGKEGAQSPQQADRAAWEKARSSVGVGKTYVGPDGKPYLRKN